MEYGKRICVICGSEFNAEYSSQVCCSDTCRIARKRQSARASGKRKDNEIMKMQIIINSLKATIQNDLHEIAELKKRIEGHGDAVATPDKSLEQSEGNE